MSLQVFFHAHLQGLFWNIPNQLDSLNRNMHNQLMSEEEKKRGPGGARPGAGRKPAGGRKKGVFVALDDSQYKWVQAQPEGSPGYLRRLSDEDQAKREKPQA